MYLVSICARVNSVAAGNVRTYIIAKRRGTYVRTYVSALTNYGDVSGQDTERFADWQLVE